MTDASETEFHPLPWRKVEQRSSIAIKDYDGATVLSIQLTGKSSRTRKHSIADMIIQTVNRRQAG